MSPTCNNITIVSLKKGEIERFPPFSVLLRGTLCRFSQIFLEKFWWFPKLYLNLQPCRIRSNAEVRLPNVTHRQRHEVELSYTDFLHLFFVYMFSHNSHSNFYYGHIDKKDRFTEFGKSSLDERFVFLWAITPPFATFSNTSILCITSKYIKNESTTANKILTIRARPPLRRSPCRSDKRKKTSVMT